VFDRETGDRLVVQAVTDRRADDVAIDAADTTVADYPTNEGYPTDDLVVEASYLGDVARERTRNRRYSFPLSRLELADDAEFRSVARLGPGLTVISDRWPVPGSVAHFC